MKYQIKEIINFMEGWAKNEYQLSWDNSGKQIYFDEETDNVVVGMDLTDKLIDEAIENGSKLIITHHPLFFAGIKNICQGSYVGDNIIRLIENKISVLSCHTSLDIAAGGVNCVLFNKLALEDMDVLTYEEEKPMGLVGSLSEEMSLDDFINLVKEKLDVSNIRIYGKNPDKMIKRVSVMGGSGAEFMKIAKSKSDVFVTADVKYHDGQWAYENDFYVLDLGHFHSEKVVLDEISERIKEKFHDLDVHVCKKSSFELD
ncbi:Nif3-like dinuclear metal center hexameric protein [Peptoniphilus sp.]|jgi:dinuclear metal center YbgI/SA1388 family protein|uniref:Nif3-like dinuclear metal center hexameric protein n=1 Tax=Peptoniphilus sp. TaxID=1971214 RepID=UPI003D905E48